MIKFDHLKSRCRRKIKFDGPGENTNIKKWAVVAIKEERRNPPHQMWKNEPTPEDRETERLKRVRFCRKHSKADPELNLIADCLESCGPRKPCYSGACPECGRLFQRFYVRQSKGVIRDIIEPEGRQLIALCVIPLSGLVRPGRLDKFSIINFQRRIKAALDAAGINSGIGGVDFSFNEDRDGKWSPFICPHIYLITSTDDREKLRRALKKTFPKRTEVPRPIKLPLFENKAYRRSYSLKMNFKPRISHNKKRKGKTTKSRNTSTDRLRVDQRIELYKYLHKIGLAARIIFRGIKPEVSNSKVRFRKT